MPTRTTAPAPRVFLSYARTDAGRVAELGKLLRNADLQIFQDTEDILPSEAWKERLAGLIGAADVVIFFLSAASARSEVCGWEASHAEQLAKRIVPVVIGDIQGVAAPKSLARLNTIDAVDAMRDAETTRSIVAAVETDIGWVREHTRIGEAARRWQARGQPADLLLRGAELAASETWLTGRPKSAPEPTDLDRAFIAVARRTASRRTRLGTLAALAAALILGIGGWLAVGASKRDTASKHQRVVGDVIEAATALDARLGFIRTALKDGPPPTSGLPPALTAETDRILAERRLGSLRQKLNGRPLPLQAGASIRSTVSTLHLDAALVNRYEAAIASVQDRTEDLFTVLRSAADERCQDAPGIGIAAYHASRRALAERAVRHDSQLVHRTGLELLNAIGADVASVDARLTALSTLAPRMMTTPAELGQLAERDHKEMEAIHVERRRLLGEATRINDACIGAAKRALEDDLAIKPTDLTHEVIGKAKSLRQLGRKNEAIKAFEAFGRMFPGVFPDVAAYVEAAKAFTRDIEVPGSPGAIWVEKAEPGGPAQTGGLEAGDIILSYGGRTVSFVEEMKQAIEAAVSAGAPVKVIYARRGVDGRYGRHALEMPAAPKLGIAYRPI